jgi:tetratricopeptide (TPR) repeat protein
MEVKMRKIILGGAMLVLLAACYGGGGKSTTSQIASLMSPEMANQEAASKNNEGVDHLAQGHYDVSKPLFEQAIAAQADFAEAHFNLGVTLDGQGDHPGATEAFKKAAEFGKGNPKIAESEILKKHLGM